MDIIVHVPEHLLARADELVRQRKYATRCQLIAKALRYYLDLKHPQVTEDQYEEAQKAFVEQMKRKEDEQ